MIIKEATTKDKQHWNDFVRKNKTGSFLQSWQWADFTLKLHDKGWRFLIEDDSGILAAFFIVKKNLKLKQSQLSCPRGPVIKNGLNVEEQTQVLKLMEKKITELADREKVMVFQCDPFTTKKSLAEKLINLGFNSAPRNDQPKYTLILPLEKDAEELLKQMHQKTRYNIRLAEKKGVKIVIDNSRLDDFFAILQKTESRQKVKFFSKKYFAEILKLDFVKLYLAEFKGKIIAANIMVFYNDTATYLFGGTDNEYRKHMAPHLLQWQAILDAKKQGFLKYDFWGAAPANVTGHEKKWAGVTRFKQGFAPKIDLTKYIGTYEKIYCPFKLKAYRLLQKIF